MKRLGQVIREARDGAGLTQEALAEACGLSAAYISQVESGRRADPQFSTVAKICAALHLSLDDVAAAIAGSQRAHGQSADSGATIPAQLRRIAALLESSRPKKR